MQPPTRERDNETERKTKMLSSE